MINLIKKRKQLEPQYKEDNLPDIAKHPKQTQSSIQVPSTNNTPMIAHAPLMPPPSGRPSGKHRTLRNINDLTKPTCLRPEGCLPLGEFREAIYNYFEKFRNLSLIKPPLKVLASGINGRAYKAKFKKNGLTATCILKQKLIFNSDSLLYEYIVGKLFVNNVATLYPCFVNTYNLLTPRTPIPLNQVQAVFNQTTQAHEEKVLPADVITFEEVDQSFNVDNHSTEQLIKMSCKYSLDFLLITEYFDKCVSFWDMVTNHFDDFNPDILSSIFQVYYPLSLIKDKFTHYDLHLNNILIYRPFSGTKNYIMMKYHYNGTIIEFPTEYLVKIIDYGRSYFKTDNMDSKQIFNIVCSEKECNPNCGSFFGYSWFSTTPNEHYICTQVPNASHDLQALRDLKYLVPDLKDAFFPNSLNNDQFGFEYNNQYTVSTVVDELINGFNYTINGTNTKTTLKNFIDVAMKTKYNQWKLIATLNIYDDGRPYDLQYL